MIKEINMPMMAAAGGGSSSDLTWDDIPSAGPADIQSGRNVYIELNEDRTATKASAGKILQFIKEGYMPVYKEILHMGEYNAYGWACVAPLSIYETDGVVTKYRLVLHTPDGAAHLYAYPDALEKPFTTVQRSDSGSGQTNN